MNLEEVKAYLDEDYWERGISLKKSGYENRAIDEWWERRLVEALFQSINLKGKIVLDLGAALGGIVYFLLEQGVDSYGIDLSGYAIQKGKKLQPILENRTWESSAHELQMFPDNYFDFIYSNQVLEHIPEELIPAMCSELNRVMKPGAIAWVGLVFGNDVRGENDPDVTHITLKPREWWEEKLRDAGLKIDYSYDEKFRQHRLSDGYNFFEEYKWHSISFTKI